ncbi:hypothetical protein [Mesorhizobium sp.]|uniref:hypothetical protein n=1 Tax=Mesorhizobium sp. TaxID=1871066 RepID=UPI000FE37B8E|nr:hypothetical protein [Mesorhizobium sp.]RWM57441.1 MAG: hypothetical protein EOR78_09215 [Mesorhizobium sp.]RWM59079.1 MAG: hypothetical protein EOR79_12215 [Mesorhizobium sp.]RWM93316.1 MAG: hypothetical protein EOR85_27080 [Mesorhizobium sp.]RWN55570.1 MAG: hypothetical protein EOR98_12250 [Mesorhizobium sp.]RWN77280.1 MAG: hypothetical protein EOS02_12245 [Mesorhizobium sp.]
MTPTRAAPHDPKTKGRSGVSNGNKTFVAADGRTVWAKRFRDLVSDHASDLGGSENLSQSQKALVRRAAALGIELERMEGDLAEGRPVDLDLFGRLSGHQRRILETLGIERKAKNVTPTLQQYRAQRQAGGL